MLLKSRCNKFVNKLLLSSFFSRIIGNNFPLSIYLFQSIKILKEVKIDE
jgi:hypothetical protein